jgi:hypothetical protein
MSEGGYLDKSRWCIVVADDHGAEWAPTINSIRQPVPLQYGRLGESTTLLQNALRRTARIAPVSQLMVTAMEQYREHWESALWFVHSGNRFTSARPSASLLTTAAALRSIAAQSPSNIVTILPARCHVAHEWVLRAAVEHALNALPHVPEGVLTLGMMDIDDGIGEDYLVGERVATRPGLPTGICQTTNRLDFPSFATARSHGGIWNIDRLCRRVRRAYLPALPGLTLQLTRLMRSASLAGVETEIPSDLHKGVPSPVLRSLRWHPPSFPQRAFRVHRSGWTGLKSPRAVANVSAFISSEVLSADTQPVSATVAFGE